MFHVMDHIEASFVVSVEDGTLNRFEQRNICVLTVITLGIALLTVYHDMIFSVCRM